VRRDDEGQIVGRQPVVLCRDTPTSLDLVEEPFDQIVGAIQVRTEANRIFAISFRWGCSDTGLRQWQKCARKLREDPDELVEMLTQMAKQLLDETNAARTPALDEGLDETFCRESGRAADCARPRV